MKISKVKGTHDFLDLTLFNFVVQQIRSYVNKYNFSEIKTPILEPTELFKRSLGLHTDVVTKEMFVVKTDSNSDEICLRPEATAPTMRAFLEHSIQLVPWKVFSIGPMFRHERPQKGRYRQFYQANFEIIDAPSIVHDVQMITMLDRLFQDIFLLDMYALHINFLGTSEGREKFKKKLADFLDNHVESLCETCKVRKEKNILRIFDCKNKTCKELYYDAPHIIDHLSKESQKEWEQIQEQLSLLSISYSVVPTLVRGLDYYDTTVFEFVSDNLGAQSAFCSGGRYDTLATQLGAKKNYPSIGAALGIERLLLLLESIQDSLSLPHSPPLHLIIPIDVAQEGIALLLADELHAIGLSVDILIDGSLKSRMRKANKMGAKYILLLGEEEQKNRTVTLKNMVTGQEQNMLQTEVLTFLKQ